MTTSKTEPAPSSTAGAATAKAQTRPYGKIVLTLKNVLLDEEKLAVTPSEQDGLDKDTEMDLRIYGCELIQTAGILLKLPQVAMATGQVLLQRFYYSKSFVRQPVEQTAMACICLASKIEEAPRRVRDIISVFMHVRQVNCNKPIQPVILDQPYIHLKNQVIKAERRVLKELGFSVHFKHPHKIIVMYLQVLNYEKNQNLMQFSWNYMNDSLRTDVFVRYQPETVACACIYLTARKLKIPLPKNPAWYTLFGVSEEQIHDVCFRILRLYNRPKVNVEALEKKVEELVRKYQEAKVKARGGSGNNTPSNNSPSSPGGKTTGAHNAWGGFISRSGSHAAALNNTTTTTNKHNSPNCSPTTNHTSHSPHTAHQPPNGTNQTSSSTSNTKHSSSSNVNNHNNNNNNNSSKQQQREVDKESSSAATNHSSGGGGGGRGGTTTSGGGGGSKGTSGGGRKRSRTRSPPTLGKGSGGGGGGSRYKKSSGGGAGRRRSYSRSRSASPVKNVARKSRDKRRSSRSPSNDRENNRSNSTNKYDKYDRYESSKSSTYDSKTDSKYHSNSRSRTNNASSNRDRDRSKDRSSKDSRRR